MKTYRRNPKKNKTKKNKRRYKLKGGMGPGAMPYSEIRCPNCGSSTMYCSYTAGSVPKPNAECHCTNEEGCHKYSPYGNRWAGTYAELVKGVQK
jgi:hypothetical protein